ncbi:Putative aminoglycoside phosphotransferase, protein kinase-like domain superfamily [Septoria linicola]|uniref:Aminoglycoside phosphotransferase, protein kinase-like domain superfamily n=1 Tax=Septoria linicola TaxID=215465 RepID=A0A9Q9B7B6_9PEZI|nr:putative aminoglycoside phosphotransferase, protein kinase-like domain superfamily [Septoria linicola]USW58647.1 Putative aminoglycoside phosphotransferase, protein kinase-like domain superfamily [Septoria linicola]
MGSIEISTEVIEQPPTWHKSIHEYLDEYNLKCRKATPLQGGASAYIWKIEGLTKDGSEPRPKPQGRAASEVCILKYGDETAKSVASLELEPNRMLAEARAMQSKIVRRVCYEEPSVEVPRMVSKTDQAVIMSWAGDTDLRSALIADKNLDAQDIGSRLGRWIATLHLAGIDDAEVRDWSSATAKSVMKNEEDNLCAKLSKDSHFTEEDIEKAGSVYHGSDVTKTLAVWDFRPMNTLLRPGPSAERPRVTVVDWEVASYGDAAWDVRLWAAEAIVLESQHGSERGLLQSFLTAYRERAGERLVDLKFVCRVAVLIGGIWELLMPCSIWDIEEGEDAESWRKEGHQYVRAGIDADREWLLKSRLAPLLQ